MEHLWSLAGPISGNRWQLLRPQERRNQAKTVATGCDQLPIGADGKEGPTVALVLPRPRSQQLPFEFRDERADDLGVELCAGAAA